MPSKIGDFDYISGRIAKRVHHMQPTHVIDDGLKWFSYAEQKYNKVAPPINLTNILNEFIIGDDHTKRYSNFYKEALYWLLNKKVNLT